MFLLDTNVVSELRKTKGYADENVLAWAASTQPTLLFLSVISVLEIETGILRIDRRDKKQSKMLRKWLEEQVMPSFNDRILPIDVPVAKRCATIQVPTPRASRDSFIAATALVHNLTVVTRNVLDFEQTGVALLNPWTFSS